MKHVEDEGAGINQLPPGLLNHIFSFLGPFDLCRVTATCKLWRQLNRDHAANSTWRQFYCSRWHSAVETVKDVNDVCWQSMYGSKMLQGKAWTGKYHSDGLYGHRAAVKALQLLPSHNLLVTGSVDKTCRIWDLQLGMPVSVSKPHGATIRAVAVDPRALVTGCGDNIIRVWDPTIPYLGSSSRNGLGLPPGTAAATSTDDVLGDQLPRQRSSGWLARELEAAAAAAAGTGGSRTATDVASVASSNASQWLFDLTAQERQLTGHIGPVDTLCLTNTHLVSGSWDYTARVWQRGSWECVRVHKYSDWVASVVVRGPHLLVAANEVHVHDMATGDLVRKFEGLHEGAVRCLEGTRNGKLLFTGGDDGLVLAHDLRMRDPTRIVWHHNSVVMGLGYDDPWMVTCATDGGVMLLNTEELHLAGVGNSSHGSRGGSSPPTTTPSSANGRHTSQLVGKRCLSSSGGPTRSFTCVDIADQWVAAGGNESVVQTWDFTRAAEAAARAAAARASRNSKKHRRRGGNGSGASGSVGQAEAAGAWVAVPRGGARRGNNSSSSGSGSSHPGSGGEAAGATGSSPGRYGGQGIWEGPWAGSPPCPLPIRPRRGPDQSGRGPTVPWYQPKGTFNGSCSSSGSPQLPQWRPGANQLRPPPYGSPVGHPGNWPHQAGHQQQQQQQMPQPMCFSAPAGPWGGSWGQHSAVTSPPWHGPANGSSSRRSTRQPAVRVPPVQPAAAAAPVERTGVVLQQQQQQPGALAAGTTGGAACSSGSNHSSGASSSSSSTAVLAAAANAAGSSTITPTTTNTPSASKAAAASRPTTVTPCMPDLTSLTFSPAPASASQAPAGADAAASRMATWQLPQRTRSFGSDGGGVAAAAGCSSGPDSSSGGVGTSPPGR